ncbi:Hypothetical predicted protein [Pelobates cultripes]|uniref:Uncharacterized protein n=1 Tax=Pelobates cultripes TaxID=61616 RepID=A0AAD1WWI6_PELCU|nr:Hypothetical predicted protein [Pelobates cultripes]
METDNRTAGNQQLPDKTIFQDGVYFHYYTMISIDLKDAYYQTPIHHQYCRLLRFHIFREHVQFRGTQNLYENTNGIDSLPQEQGINNYHHLDDQVKFQKYIPTEPVNAFRCMAG